MAIIILVHKLIINIASASFHKRKSSFTIRPGHKPTLFCSRLLLPIVMFFKHRKHIILTVYPHSPNYLAIPV